MLSTLKKNYNNLCSPAQCYLVITLAWLVLTLLLDVSQENYACTLVYSFIWVFILNILCKRSEKMAWAVFLLPIFFHILILMAVMCFLGSATAEIIFDDKDGCPHCENGGPCNCDDKDGCPHCENGGPCNCDQN